MPDQHQQKGVGWLSNNMIQQIKTWEHIQFNDDQKRIWKWLLKYGYIFTSNDVLNICELMNDYCIDIDYIVEATSNCRASKDPANVYEYLLRKGKDASWNIWKRNKARSKPNYKF